MSRRPHPGRSGATLAGWLLPFALAAAMIAPYPSLAQAPPEEPVALEGDTLGWHTVRPGDTLEKVTELYLGTKELWPENWRLNPQLADPDRLRIGQRIRVIVGRELPERSARIVTIARRVDEKPQPAPWREAEVGDLLSEDDGVRTYRRSSARLAFDDGVELVLNEDSLVFLRRLGSSLTGIFQQTVEVVDGQADLKARPRRVDSSEIEVVVGGATLRPVPGITGLAEGRARRLQEGGAQLMVYSGLGHVEAAGGQVEVAAGMGTRVPEGGPPAPPEKLLPRAVGQVPAAGSHWSFSNPTFSWLPLDGAASYTVEVCRDASCHALVSRQTGLTEPSWRSDALPTGELYWRVTAVSASGLDGYPGRSLAFRIDGEGADLEPPVVALVLLGPGQVLASDRVLLGDGGSLRLEAHDDASGVTEVRYRWDDGPWEIWNHESLAPPRGTADGGTPGEHHLEIEATDGTGKTSAPRRITTQRTATTPEPPTVRRAGRSGG